MREAFVDDTIDDYNVMIKQHPALDPDVIVPSLIVPQKLQGIWKSTHAAYKKAVTKITASGTHNTAFYSFCDGRLDALYLHLHLPKRPGLTSTVNGELPSDVFSQSTDDSQHQYTSATY